MKTPPIEPIPPPDSHYASSAEGWLELGDPESALGELESISTDHQSHPHALEILWAACAALESWEAGRDAANALVEAAPFLESGWIHRAYATRRMPGGSLETAWQVLYPAAKLFPEQPLIPYNLACYACQMGRLAEAKSWLERAFRTSGDKRETGVLKKMALEDPDLGPMHPVIQGM